ncbi:unnamed protein product [Phytophthora fragariaefolia]|uniref:Unnamed protein product n=1 Tax=Phytophthora fragariaefolia TaxID=1490495 RepID=A0A9W7D226_9STRA|nr:unnamed protein product [Phytophthora fragariaefolia]
MKAGYTVEAAVPQSSALPFPMAVKTWRDRGDTLVYPLFVQPNLDGVRMLAHLKSDGFVHLATRRLHYISGFEAMKEALSKMFGASRLKTLIIDGELYSHGANLQTISGIDGNIWMSEPEKEKLQFRVFDGFAVNKPQMSFKERHALLEIFLLSAESKFIQLTKTKRVDTPYEANLFFMKTVAKGYEATPLKTRDCRQQRSHRQVGVDTGLPRCLERAEGCWVGVKATTRSTIATDTFYSVVPATGKLARITCLERKQCWSTSCNTVRDLYALQLLCAFEVINRTLTVCTGNPTNIQEGNRRQHVADPASRAADGISLDTGLHATSAEDVRLGSRTVRSRVKPSAGVPRHDAAGSAPGDHGDGQNGGCIVDGATTQALHPSSINKRGVPGADDGHHQAARGDACCGVSVGDGTSSVVVGISRNDDNTAALRDNGDDCRTMCGEKDNGNDGADSGVHCVSSAQARPDGVSESVTGLEYARHWLTRSG